MRSYHLFPTHWLLMTPTVAFNSVRFFLVPQASLLPGTSESLTLALERPQTLSRGLIPHRGGVTLGRGLLSSIPGSWPLLWGGDDRRSWSKWRKKNKAQLPPWVASKYYKASGMNFVLYLYVCKVANGALFGKAGCHPELLKCWHSLSVLAHSFPTVWH